VPGVIACIALLIKQAVQPRSANVKVSDIGTVSH